MMTEQQLIKAINAKFCQYNSKATLYKNVCDWIQRCIQ